MHNVRRYLLAVDHNYRSRIMFASYVNVSVITCLEVLRVRVLFYVCRGIDHGRLGGPAP